MSLTYLHGRKVRYTGAPPMATLKAQHNQDLKEVTPPPPVEKKVIPPGIDARYYIKMEDRSGEVDFILQHENGTPIKYRGKPCFGVTQGTSNKGIVAIHTYIPDDKEYIKEYAANQDYLHWMYNDSPWAEFYLNKDATLDYCSVKADIPADLTLQALIGFRTIRNYTTRSTTRKKILEQGFCMRDAFILSHLLEWNRNTEDFRWMPAGHEYVPYWVQGNRNIHKMIWNENKVPGFRPVFKEYGGYDGFILRHWREHAPKGKDAMPVGTDDIGDIICNQVKYVTKTARYGNYPAVENLNHLMEVFNNAIKG